MKKHYNYLTIDLDKKVYSKLRAMQFDTKSRYILVNLISNNLAYDLTDTTVKIYGLKNDEKEFFNNAVIKDAKNGQFEIELTNQALAVHGQLEIQVLIMGANGEKLTSSSFYIEVGKSNISESAIESTNEFNVLTEGLKNLAEYDVYRQNVNKNKTDIAAHDKKLDEHSSQIKEKAKQSDLEVERARINSFTKLTEGSTTGDAELIDARVGYDGVSYNNLGEANRTQFKNITSKINQSENILDNKKWVEGFLAVQKVVDGVKTLAITENKDFCYIEIPIKGGIEYTVSKYAHQICFGKYVNGNFALRTAIGSGQTVNNPFTFITYATDTTVFINKRKEQKFVMLTEGNTSPSHFIEFGDKFVNELTKELTYTVGNNKDFESFTDCIRFLKNDKRNKTIYVYEGNYDIFSELGGSTYANSFTESDVNNYNNIVDWIPPNTNITGIGKVKLLYTPLAESTNKYASRIFSTINVRSNCKIENIEIYCKNGRYCIHDETGSDEQFTGAVKRFRNVKCIHFASDDSVASMHQCVGGGLHKGMFIEYENCYFDSQHPKYGNTFSYHNSGDEMTILESSKINLKNCIIVKNSSNPNPTVRFGNCNTTLTDINVDICSSYIDSNLSITNEFENSNLVNAFNVTLLNCNDVETIIDASNNQYDIKKYNIIR